MKQSNQPPPIPAIREAAWFWLQPLAAGPLWVCRGRKRRSRARKQLGISQELGLRTPPPLHGVNLRRGPCSDCEPITPLKSFVLLSAHRPQETSPCPSLLQPGQPRGRCADSSDLTTAKITFPGKCFHLRKRTLRKYRTQQRISNFFLKQMQLSVSEQTGSAVNGLASRVSKKYLTGTE